VLLLSYGTFTALGKWCFVPMACVPSLMKVKLILCLMVVSWCCMHQADAKDFYASPAGLASGDGSAQRPWDLGTAFENNTYVGSRNFSVKPGDTIWLRDGTYYGATNGNAFKSFLTGNPDAPIIVRAYPGERPVIEATTANTTGLYIDGGFTWYWGIEIWNSDANRYAATRNNGISCFAPGTKLINLIIHDTGNGIGCWEHATSAEIYGCLIYNCGCEYPSAEGKYHGIYSHSSEPGTSIRENVILNGFGFGLHCYSDRGEPLSGYRIEGNISINAGILNTNPSVTHLPNFLVGGYTPARGLLFNNNCGYYSSGYGDNLQLGYQTYNNDDATVYSNYFVGGRITIGQWTNLTLLKNTFARFSTSSKYQPSMAMGTSLWDTNYYQSWTGWNIMGVTNYVSISSWKALTGFDANSTFEPTTPSKPVVLVRANAYEPGRATIIVYNWALADTVTADISGVLSPGENYEVRNAQDYFGPVVLKGSYDGQPLPLPMRGLSVSKPVGHSSAPVTGPQFNVFVILKKASGRPTPPPALRLLSP
jgi:hypothetical protein